MGRWPIVWIVFVLTTEGEIRVFDGYQDVTSEYVTVDAPAEEEPQVPAQQKCFCFDPMPTLDDSPITN